MSYEHRDDDDVLHDEVVHPDEVSGALGRIRLGLRSTPEPVVLIIAPAGQVRARPLVRFLCHLPRAEGAHERLRIGLSQDLPRELEIGVEVALRIHVAWIRREVHGADHRLQLAFDAGPDACLLDDRLHLLSNRLIHGLKQDFQSDATLRADAIRTALPPGSIEDRVRLVDAELPAGIRRHVRWAVHEVRRGVGLTTPDVFLDGLTIDEQRERGADGRICEKGMGGLDARTLAVDLAPGIGLVELDVFHVRGPPDDKVALGALLQPLEDLVLHLHAPRVIVFAGLQDGAPGRHGITAALQFHGVEEGTIRDMVHAVDLSVKYVARLEIHETVWTRPHRPEIRGSLTRFIATKGFEDVAWQDHAGGAAERICPIRSRSLEDDLHRVIVKAIDVIDTLVGARTGRRRRRVGGVLPRENNVVGRERASVVPGDTAF